MKRNSQENLIEVSNIEIGQEIRLLLEEFTLSSQLEEGARDRRFYAVFIEGKLILRRGEKAYKARNLRGLYLIDDSQH